MNARFAVVCVIGFASTGVLLGQTRPAQQQQAQAAALRAQQETLLRQRQEITNRFYLRYPQPISPDNRIVGGKLHNVKDPDFWEPKKGECAGITADGIVVQQFRIEVERVYGPRKSSSLERQGLVVGGFPSPRTVLSTKDTRVPTQKLLLKNVPDARTVTDGQGISVYAARAGTVDVTGQRLECWDCGLPDSVANRKKAGIAVPTPEQIAAAQEEIAAAFKEVADKWSAAQRQAGEAAADKKVAGDAKALNWNMEQAAKGEAYGLLRMGQRYRDGDGVQKDAAKAREYFTKAVQAGSPSAEAELSRLNQASTNVPDTK
jgi:hypothetical protein